MPPFVRFAMRGLAAACLLAFAAAAPKPVHAEGAKVILVLDASGSMWGQIEGRTKIEIAREAVAKILSTWRPSDDLGLIAYGHRTKGDCNDIELMIEPGPLNKDAFQSTVNGLNPKGKTPMTEAVRRAAGALKSTEQAATVILVSDGEETCNADPCAVARELEAAGVGLTVHAVGFDIADPKTKAELQCLAENTGGMFVSANNAEELEKALQTTVAAAQEAKPEPKTPEPPAAPASPVTLEATAVMAEGGPNIADGLAWQVFAVDTAGQPAGEAIEYSYDIPYEAALEPGNYVLRVSHGLVVAEKPITIEAGKTAKEMLVLDAGIARIRAYDKEGASEPLDAAFTLRNGDGSIDSTEYGTEVSFIAAAGTWKLTVGHGAATMTTDVTVRAGETTELDVVIGTGTVYADAIYSAGGDAVADGLLFELIPASNPKGDPLVYSYDAKSEMVVPAGDYILRTSAGLAKVTEPVSVPAGGEASVTAVLGAGVLAVARSDAFSSCEMFGAKKDIAGNRAYFGTYYDPEFQTVAPAGDYVVVCSRDDGTKEEKPATVNAGERTETAL